MLGPRFGSGFAVCTLRSSSPKGRCNIDFDKPSERWRQPTRQLQRLAIAELDGLVAFVWSHAGVAFLHGSSYNVSRRGTESVVYSNLIFGNMLVFTARGGLLGRGCAHGGKRPRVGQRGMRAYCHGLTTEDRVLRPLVWHWFEHKIGFSLGNRAPYSTT